MSDFLIFGAATEDCAHCGTMKDFAKNNGVKFEFVMAAEDAERVQKHRVRGIPTAIRLSDGASLHGTGGMKEFFKV